MKMLTKAIARALAVEGWMQEQELVWLAEKASTHKHIVEIGSYLGRSTSALAENTPGVVYAFDDWKGPRDVFMSKEERALLLPKFKANVFDLITAGKIKVFVGDHRKVETVEIKADMVFIDGSHEYEDVKQDILFWKEQLIPGGLICGHDFDWLSVREAVLETLGEVEVARDTNIWYKEVQ